VQRWCLWVCPAEVCWAVHRPCDRVQSQEQEDLRDPIQLHQQVPGVHPPDRGSQRPPLPAGDEGCPGENPRAQLLLPQGWPGVPDWWPIQERLQHRLHGARRVRRTCARYVLNFVWKIFKTDNNLYKEQKLKGLADPKIQKKMQHFVFFLLVRWM